MTGCLTGIRKRTVLLFFLATTVVVYGNTFLNDWTYDDVPVIVQNPDAHSLKGFVENSRPGRPLRELTYIPEYHLFGEKPAGYRVQQLAWHGMNGFLLVLVFGLLGVELPYALLGALFFLVHPLQSESVANLSHRKELLTLFFSLVSLYGYVKAAALAGGRRVAFMAVAVAGYVVALLANETVITLPLLVILVECYGMPRERRILLRRPLLLAVSGAIAAAYLLYTFRGFIRPEQLLTIYSKNSFMASRSYLPLFMGSMTAFGFYLWKIVLPVGLAPEYTFRLAESFLQPWALLSGTLLVVLVTVMVRAARRLPLLSLGIGWFFVFWLPVSNLVPVAYLAADRYMYLCLPGVGLALAVLLQRLRSAKVEAGFCAVLLVLAVLTAIQNGYWRTEHTLWRHAVAVNPDSTWVQETVALSYLLTDETDKAVAHAREAIRLNRLNTRAYLTLAKAEERRGNLAEAVKNYEFFAAYGGMEYPSEAADVQASLPALRERLALQKTNLQ
ncbi:hypothetical protein GeomeDRAFT_1449 [Geobacter metallireducens RCH3]|nr:hypothetical protein GeomeDRAFT_1449 [Geobacter metallireducens RCH3]